ncbi:DNA helicase IV [Morganella psychrotolerans]|uniref:DNA 3'-5' helicase n=1 Tax=Morganella psychrotolerans TaxID=368603 RepID=A0A1B8HE46_9GAMM|nr:DNA helicase IV [Morganella psychrotolerans]OBU07341.1 DNA helicase IV [Morganella psychrotolerans]
MELKSTQMGQTLARHPYNRVRLLNAGIEVSGEKHRYVIPFNELINIQCKRGIVWGEMEFELPDEQVVRLHGTQWQETQQFYHYLTDVWTRWSDEMSVVSAQVLEKQAGEITAVIQADRWLTQPESRKLRDNIIKSFSALPLPQVRLNAFENCAAAYQFCLGWLENTDKKRRQRNRDWSQQCLETYADFFANIESSPLNQSQSEAVVNGEPSVLVLAGAGSGKTSVLVARAGWLLRRQQALPEQILMLAFGRQAADEMNERIQRCLHTDEIRTKTFHALALHIIREATNKSPVISALESDTAARHELIKSVWQTQCREKKAQAKGWRELISISLNWLLDEGEYWEDEALCRRIVPRIDRWLSLMRMNGGSQKVMIESAEPDIAPEFTKQIKLMAPFLKAWKSALKEEGATDFSGLIHQAVNLIEKGRFISPWKAVLVDEFQDISPLRANIIHALRAQNPQTTLFAVGDDWQAIYRFSGAELTLTTDFSAVFGEGGQCALDTTYRFNSRIGEVANQFIQRNPQQLAKPLNSLTKGDKKAVLLLPDTQLDALLNKMSGYVTAEETILILARYHHLKPDILSVAATRWPQLNIRFMTMHGSKGQQADYVILTGLTDEKDGFPAAARESVIEQGLLPREEEFQHAEERRLMYVALTRAKKQVWLLYDNASPSCFAAELADMGVSRVKKP